MAKVVAGTVLVLAVLAARAAAAAPEKLTADDILSDVKKTTCVGMDDPRRMYDRGLLLLTESSVSAKYNGADCLMMAAYKDYSPAQMELATAYSKGEGVSYSLPFAYKWAMMAYINGHKPAGKLAADIEARLSTEDFRIAQREVNSAVQYRQTKDLQAQDRVTAYLQSNEDEAMAKLDINSASELRNMLATLDAIYSEDDEVRLRVAQDGIIKNGQAAPRPQRGQY
ncbi:hypothetical protein FACS1894186_2430 [Alphaproteobacteria bacterium]|nr:hypothetical protein FACS1894186_2430 [Alphaproteobacteria bacterium]